MGARATELGVAITRQVLDAVRAEAILPFLRPVLAGPAAWQADETIRRELRVLETENVVVRLHGAVRLAPPAIEGPLDHATSVGEPWTDTVGTLSLSENAEADVAVADADQAFARAPARPATQTLPPPTSRTLRCWAMATRVHVKPASALCAIPRPARSQPSANRRR